LLGKALIACFGLGVPVILFWSWRAGSRAEFQMMVAAMVLITFNTVFWSLFEQAGSSLTLFADRNTDRHVFGDFALFAPDAAIQLDLDHPAGPCDGHAVDMAGQAGGNLDPGQFALALIGVGAGFLLLVGGSHFADSVSGGDLVAGGLYVIHSIAELCISPVGLSMITKLSIARVVGLMMGMWFVSMALGEYGAGRWPRWPRSRPWAAR
jgi:POT family proton-dependent oligopeptide transporter